MWNRIGRTLATIGLKLARVGLKLQGAKTIASMSLYDPDGIKCVAMSAGEGVNWDFLLAAVNPPVHVADVRVLVEGPGFVKLFTSELDARSWLSGYFNATNDDIRVTLFVDGSERGDKTVNADGFDVLIPLFPLEDSVS